MPEAQVCIANIGRAQRRSRFLSGVAFLGVTLGLVVIVVAVSAPRLLRIGIFIPAVVGALGVLQAREKT